MADKIVSIDPSTKVAALLDQYPELEEVLIAMAPPFKKLKNPVLRKSIAKVASLKQAAAVGKMPVEELVNRLRVVVGQAPISGTGPRADESYLTAKPDWFNLDNIKATIIEKDEVDPNTMAITKVLPQANALQKSEILELVTTFLPAPGIDVMLSKGFLAWTVETEPGLFKTYFCKSADI